MEAVRVKSEERVGLKLLQTGGASRFLSLMGRLEQRLITVLMGRFMGWNVVRSAIWSVRSGPGG